MVEGVKLIISQSHMQTVLLGGSKTYKQSICVERL